jgi:RND family efflux transporter MFP subunit
MDLKRLKIDRGERPRPAARRRSYKWLAVLAVAAVVVWFLRAPLGRFYDRLTLPAVAIERAVSTSPLAASAVSGTAANGYIVAARRAALSADTPGRVVEMNVKEGSVVRKGDLVARLYAKEYEAAVRRANAELAAAEAAAARAKTQLEAARTRLESLRANVVAAEAAVADADLAVARAEEDHGRAAALLATGAGTQQEVDDARTKLDRARAGRTGEQARLTFSRGRVDEGAAEVAVAEATWKEAQARVPIQRAIRDQAQATLEKTEVRAPFDGVVVLKDAEVGEVVSPNSQGGNSRGAVVTMVDFASLEVQVDMPERTLAGVAIGDRARIFLDAYPDRAYAGKVERIWPTANRQKGSVELRVGFEKPDDKLRPEMGVRVVFLGDETPEKLETPEPVVLVPDSCVTRVDGRTGVFELERDVARWRVVELGEQRGGRVVVKSGLAGGESLVANPPADLKDGARVRIEN